MTTTFYVAVSTDLTKPLEFRSMIGRNFSAPIILRDGRIVRIFIIDALQDEQPLQVNIIGEDGRILAQAHVLENTTQIFSSLGILTNITKVGNSLPELPGISA